MVHSTAAFDTSLSTPPAFVSMTALEPLLAAQTPPFGPVHIQVLTGDASNRRYCRLRSLADPHRTLILMVMDPHAPLASEEAGWDGVAPDELLFTHVQRFLHPLGVAVPATFGYDPVAGLLLLEDLGDETLEAWMQGRSWEEREPLYRQGVEILVKMQVEARRSPLLAQTWPSKVAFDAPLLRWEFDHFYEYTVQARRGAVSPEAYAVIDAHFQALSEELAALPRFFVHRDYHCRNIMVRDMKLIMIDFQDAVMGPRHYDLASLLRDAYVDLPEALIERLLVHYLETFRATGESGGDDDLPTFRRHFDLMSLHRSMKAAGRFDFIDIVKKNPKLLGSIPAALRNVRRVLNLYPSLHPLRDALATRLPELRG